jgi:hypothetical protein
MKVTFFAWLTLCLPIYGFQQFRRLSVHQVHRCFALAARIDPLQENSPPFRDRRISSPRRDSSPLESTSRQAQDVKNYDKKDQAPYSNTARTSAQDQNRENKLEEELVSIEASLLLVLPLQFLVNFTYMAEQAVPRLALIALTAHVMLLVPTLSFLHESLHVSTVPFLYLGPLVVAAPFASFFAWEADLLARPDIVDDFLRR